MMSSLNSLVESGTLTEDQQDAVISALSSSSGNGDPLQSLVDDGTLTEDQKDAIEASFQSAMKMNRAREAYSQMQLNPLDALVQSGTLSEDQQDAILSAFQQSMLQGITA